MLPKKIAVLLFAHLVFAYCFGNHNYGFPETPDKYVALALIGALLLLSRYAGEDGKAGKVDMALAGAQGLFVFASGVIDTPVGIPSILIAMLLFGVSVGICYFRVLRISKRLQSK